MAARLRQLWNTYKFGCTICVLTTWVLFLSLTRLRVDDSRGCHALLNHGRWSHEYQNQPQGVSWHPADCLMHSYDRDDLNQCLSSRSLYFVGDSSARQIFWATAEKVDQALARSLSNSASKHSDLVFKCKANHIRFIWDPFLNSSKTTDIVRGAHALRNHSRGGDVESTPANAYVSAGLWYARYTEDEAKQYRDVLFGLSSQAQINGTEAPDGSHNHSVILEDRTRVVYAPAITPDYNRLSPERRKSITPSRVNVVNDQLKVLESSTETDVAWTNLEMTQNVQPAFHSDGFHVSRHVATAQADIFLNRVCNQILRNQGRKLAATCCVGASQSNLRGSRVMPERVISVLNEPSILLALLGGTVFTYATCQTFGFGNLQAFVVLLSSVSYCFLADRTDNLVKTGKVSSQQAFMWAVLVSILIGVCSLRKVNILARDCQGLLSREQTDEWKGWMQVSILLYHYFGMSRVLWIYQVIRVMVGAYLFLTGFGHATYFLKTGDYSATRLCSVLVRMNLLACALAFVMQNDYGFYYFPGLASFWFIVVYVTLWTRRPAMLTLKKVTIRVFVSACTIRTILHSTDVLKSLFDLSVFFKGPHVDVDEFVFRVRLDMYAPYCGVMCAAVVLNSQQAQLDIRRSWIRGRLSNLIPSMTLTLGALTLLTAYFVLVRGFENKIAYNAWHSSLSPIVVLALMAARYASSFGSRYYSPVFAWIGRCSLETFVLQYHIWLAADTKGLLRLGRFDRFTVDDGGRAATTMSSWMWWLEGLSISIIFLWVSWHLSLATATITKLITGVECNKDRIEDEKSEKNELLLPRSQKCVSHKTADVSVNAGTRLVVMAVCLWLLNVLTI